MRICAVLFASLAIGMCGFHGQAQTASPGIPVETSPRTYPLAAQAAGIEGKVVLWGIVGEDGHMKDIQVVKGPRELQQAALEAVKRWTFRPYTKYGKVVPVTTTAKVIFKMGSKKEKANAVAEAKAELAKASMNNPDASAR